MKTEELKELIAELGSMKPIEIKAGTPLKSALPGSFGRARLAAALRRKLASSPPGIEQARTFGDLCRMLSLSDSFTEAPDGNDLSPEQNGSRVGSTARVLDSGLHVGIDTEGIASLPQSSDYWEHEFYKDTFSEAEIAYALLQPSPRETFAGMWCAKEALCKAEPRLAGSPWKTLEVAHDALGKPSMKVNGQPAGGSLSLSHAGGIAVAIFAAGEPGRQAHEPIPAESASPAVPVVRQSSRAPFFFSVLALALSIAALAFSLAHR